MADLTSEASAAASALACLVSEQRSAFLAEHYGKRPAFLRPDVTRLGALFGWSSLAGIWDKVGTVPLFYRAHGADQRLEVPAAHVPLMLEMGATAVVDRLELHVAPLADFTTALADEIGHAGGRGARCYAGESRHGFGMHCDAYHVFAIQLDGTKRWWVASEPMQDPPDARAPITASRGAKAVRMGGRLFDVPQNIEPVDVEPGQAVYMPPFTWHRAVPQSRCLTLTIDLSDRPPRQDAGSVHLGWLGPEPA